MDEGVTRFEKGHSNYKGEKENLMEDKEHLVNGINKGEQAMSDINESLGVKRSSVLNTLKDKEFLKQVETILDDSTYVLDRNSASDCKEAIAIAKSANILRERVRNEGKKKVRYHVDLSEDMGKSFTELAEKMGLTLSAVVKLFLMDDWQKLQVSGFDYIYLGVADKPKEIPYIGQ